MFINLLIYAVAAAFSVYVIITACRNFVGYNPTAPSSWERLKSWWPGFVKRNIVDDDPYDDESHAATRYVLSCPHCGTTPYIVVPGKCIGLDTYEAICDTCGKPRK